MAVEISGDEPSWAGEKRDFVADSRDVSGDERDIAADARDVIAEARDVTADAREAMLDRREESLNVADIGAETADAAAAAERASASMDRDSSADDREHVNAARQDATNERLATEERRIDAGQPTLLALAFARIAEQLYDAQTYDDVLRRIAEAAVATVSGGYAASVTLHEQGEFRTAASTDPSAIGVDEAQYQAHEGPNLDAFTTPMVDAPTFPDDRWPLLGGIPTTYGVESSLSYQLHTKGDDGSDAGTGSLNIYAETPEAFDQAAEEIGSIMAAHASLAARAVGNRIALQHLGENLQNALLSRDVIGQAKGILMDRLKVTPEEAFDILRSSSQRLNVKLREVADELTHTGDVLPQDRKRPPLSPGEDASVTS